jgi:outer membrane protein assembly factor BamD (BamD/ComL family)
VDAVGRVPAGPIPASPARPTPDELYRTAEAALVARDRAAADRVLATLIAEYPGSRLVDQALYERARIAYQQRAWPAARSHLAGLAAVPNTPLAEPGHYLRCRIAVEARDASAAACLADYRAAFPRSTHDLDALALLAQLAHQAAGCAGAAKLVDELAQNYPRTKLAAAWRARCPEAR